MSFVILSDFYPVIKNDIITDGIVVFLIVVINPRVNCLRIDKQAFTSLYLEIFKMLLVSYYIRIFYI